MRRDSFVDRLMLVLSRRAPAYRWPVSPTSFWAAVGATLGRTNGTLPTATRARPEPAVPVPPPVDRKRLSLPRRQPVADDLGKGPARRPLSPRHPRHPVLWESAEQPLRPNELDELYDRPASPPPNRASRERFLSRLSIMSAVTGAAAAVIAATVTFTVLPTAGHHANVPLPDTGCTTCATAAQPPAGQATAPPGPRLVPALRRVPPRPVPERPAGRPAHP